VQSSCTSASIPTSIARVVATDLGIVADAKEAAVAFGAAIDAVATKARLEQIRSARFDAVAARSSAQRAQQAKATQARWDAQPLSWERVTGELSRLLDKDAVVVPELADHTWENDPWCWGGRVRVRARRTHQDRTARPARRSAGASARPSA
jgi:thiamine pyrophosphate-dependent acetolactate synthase large subunit-like protein